jgi:hypothetical protein
VIEGDLVAETEAHDRAGRTEHLAHARSAARAFVADDHDIRPL